MSVSQSQKKIMLLALGPSITLTSSPFTIEPLAMSVTGMSDGSQTHSLRDIQCTYSVTHVICLYQLTHG